MKISKLVPLAALAIGLAVFSTASSQAAVIVIPTTTSYAAVSAIGTGTTTPVLGVDGWQVWDGTPSTPSSRLPSYATVANASGTALGPDTASYAMTFDGGSTKITPGYLYNGGGTGPNTVATITLQGSVPASFQLGLFSETHVSYPTTPAYVLTSTGPDGNTVTLNSTYQSYGVNNAAPNVFLADINNAIAGQTITIAVETNKTYPFLSGITFDTLVPEPATWGLLAFGLTTVMVLRRRRQG